MERARETGLFRYSLVQELTEPGLSQAERGWRARELAGRVHEGPGGRRVTVSPWELAAVVTMGSLLSPVVAFGLVRGDVLPSALG